MGFVEQKIGELLKIERDRRQLTLEEISADIKIPVENLEGIEKGDLSLLPTPVYYNLFTKTYCQALGIDYTRTIEAIRDEVALDKKQKDKAKLKINGEEVVVAAVEKDNFLTLNTTKKKLIAALAVLLIVFFAYMLVDKMLLPNGLKRNGTSEMLKGVDAERINALETFDWNVPAYRPAADLKIDIKPKSESWGTVMADGDTVLFRRLVPGRIYSASAKYRLVVSVGVPTAVDIELNGRLVDLRDPVTQRISRIEVNQANLDSYLNPTIGIAPEQENPPVISGVLEQHQSEAVKSTTPEPIIKDTTIVPDKDDES
jgi:hypothetical protein